MHGFANPRLLLGGLALIEDLSFNRQPMVEFAGI